jgi:hypothetical protein
MTARLPILHYVYTISFTDLVIILLQALLRAPQRLPFCSR